MGETHGTSGQCVSFSLIDAGSVLLPAQFFFSFHLYGNEIDLQADSLLLFLCVMGEIGGVFSSL